MNLKLSILSFYFITILVHASPEAETPTKNKVSGFLEDVKAAIGFTARLKCPTSHSPQSSLKWFKDNAEVTGNRFTTLENGDLQITDVKFTDQGAYVCSVQDSYTTVSGTRKLLVQPPTQILELNSTDHEVIEGHQAGFKCVVLVTSLSMLQELKIIWLHNGTVIDFRSEAQRFRKLIKSYAVVSDSWVIKKTTALEAGNYTCVAKTSLDNATAEKQLVILPEKQIEERSREIVNAEVVRSLKAMPLSSSALLLSWEKPEIIFGTLIGYNITYRMWGQTSWVVQRSLKDVTDFNPTSIKLNYLEENTKYKININAVTTVGPGETSSIEEQTLENSDSRLIVQCTPVFHRNVKDIDDSFEYYDYQKMIWIPWADCVNHSKHSMGSQFYIKYRRIDHLCFNQIDEFYKDYVIISKLPYYGYLPFQFIVGYIDNKLKYETKPIYLELNSPGMQRVADDYSVVPPERVKSIEKTPFGNIYFGGKMLIIFGGMLFIFGFYGFVKLARSHDARVKRTQGKQWCLLITFLSLWILFIILFFGFLHFISLTFDPSSDVLCFLDKNEYPYDD